MNKTNKYAKKTGLLLGSGLLAVLVGCTTYVEAPRSPQVYAPAAPVEVPPTQVYNPPAPAETPVYVPPQPVQITYVIREERDFYQPLSRYGRWVSVGEYGQCWVPSQVNPDWRPYTNGHWESTDAGWYWASDEPWGWATYHYGRWDWNPDFGWIWVPQTQWAPAWVSFHEGGGYVGWAPLHPSQRFARDRFEHMRDKPVAPRSYVFVKERQFLEPVRPTTVIVNNTTIINKTVNITNIKVVNNTVINEGPRTTIIEKASGKKVHAVPARDLRHQQEAAVLAVQPKTLSPASPTIQPPAHLPTPSEDKARLERLANEAKIKAQVEAQKKAKEQEIKLAQFESARLANEAKLKAQFDAQKLAVEQQLKQAETTRLVNEARVKAALEAQKKAKAEEIKTAQLQGTAPIKQPGISAQADIQNKIKEHQIKAAQSEAERRTNESKAKAQEAIHRTPPGRTFDPAALGQINKLLAINPDLKGVNASVVSNNIIQLNGLVKTPELKKRAGALVGKIQGVREIQNNITVKE